MPLLFLCILCVLLVPLSAFAQSTPPPMPSSANDSVTVIHPAPGFDYLYDQHGNSATVYETAPGFHWYSARDPQGRITSQGFLFDPISAPPPLRVPESLRYRPPESRDTEPRGLR